MEPLTTGNVRVEITADRQFGTNSYLVEDTDTGDRVVIDANLEPDAMVELAGQRPGTVRAILLTHTDVDHVAGLHRFREAFGDVPIAVAPAERQVVTLGMPLRSEHQYPLPRFANVDNLNAGETYTAGSLAFEVLPTPGHSPGGVTLKLDDLLFTGDALFAGGIGRYDFSNSDGRALLEGIRAQLFTQPDDAVVLPGHGPSSTIGEEKASNPFLREG